MATLVPWPKTPAAQATAIATLKTLLVRPPQFSDERLNRVACTVSDKIQTKAPNAPDFLKEEALLRGIGFWMDVGSGAESRRTVGEEATTYASPANWWIRSGAASCVKAYTVRRVGVIG